MLVLELDTIFRSELGSGMPIGSPVRSGGWHVASFLSMMVEEKETTSTFLRLPARSSPCDGMPRLGGLTLSFPFPLAYDFAWAGMGIRGTGAFAYVTTHGLIPA